MIIDFNHAKKVATGCLAMTSCAFLLWVSQNNAQADSTQETPLVQVNSATVNTNSQNASSESSVNSVDQGNYANLDNVQINDNGQLQVSGWHATNASQSRPYHYLIVMNKDNNTEIARQNISDQEVSRPDVAAVHNVYGANQSGFNATFNLSNQIANLNQVQLISRYTDDQQGNGNAVDYWFAPVMIDRQNHASLDSTTVDNNQLVLTGWNATNLAANKPDRFIIIYDRTTNQEVARQQITESVTREDVAKAFPNVDGAATSGFTVAIPLSKLNLSHQLQVISRYSASKDGNSNFVDYWFSPITSGTPVNQGNLDSFNLSDGQNLVVTGWHLTDLAPFENNHYAILYDQTAHSQVAVVSTTTQQRNDVAKVYPNVLGAAQSGFVGTFNLANVNIIPGHTYSIVSRYSTSNEGNGDAGHYTDFWSAPVTLNQQANSIDNIQMTKDGLSISGWMISDQSINHPYAYIIVLNNGKEVKRTTVELTSRPDVAKAYGNVYNSANSGFSTVVPLDPVAINGNMQVILRFTDDKDGNGNAIDQYSQSYASNAGNIDEFNVNGNGLYISGWHASNQAVNKPYEYLIFLDQNGNELYRQQVLDINRSRTDVANIYPATYNSAKSGYQLGFEMPANMQHQLLYVIHRFTDDKNGNGNYVDYRSGLMATSMMRTPIDYRQPSEYAPYPDLSKMNNFWIHVRIGQNRVYLMNGNDVVYTMYCTAGYYQNGVSTTPTGTYYIQAERGNSFYNGSLGEGANYWTSFLDHGVYLFHTVPTDANGNYKPYEASQLGINQGSHGCIRLSVPDAYWIMHNVPTGTRVVIDN